MFLKVSQETATFSRVQKSLISQRKLSVEPLLLAGSIQGYSIGEANSALGCNSSEEPGIVIKQLGGRRRWARWGRQRRKGAPAQFQKTTLGNSPCKEIVLSCPESSGWGDGWHNILINKYSWSNRAVVGQQDKSTEGGTTLAEVPLRTSSLTSGQEQQANWTVHNPIKLFWRVTRKNSRWTWNQSILKETEFIETAVKEMELSLKENRREGHFRACGIQLRRISKD